ncbi:hypothetical protein N658DRAFT_518997 [Parathielavia hyrcaniae]|uniref:Zn(2)-C6 fungal-type domain-containing protein n=1 Tax=Parathielavia hyrcaniae TaxID=113614 RepID=A0AAN6PWH2_9PEZI|nr:hypothetical protein N658DRAFT_518997 [Parathielavia hyrcaniae]
MPPHSSHYLQPLDVSCFAVLKRTYGDLARPQRPCDNCRKRKSRCEIPEDDTECVLCQFHNKPCTFISDAPKKKRRVSEALIEVNTVNTSKLKPKTVPSQPGDSTVESRRDQPIKDYAHLRGPSLLKKTLGLQNHRHSSLIGLTSVYEPRLLGLPAFRPGEDIAVGPRTLRKVSATETFVLEPDSGTRNHDQDIDDLDAIESLVAPHGPQLISLYFRIVHPTFPILHKRVFLEKYERTHREFSPPLLAAVYILTLNWWSYSVELSVLPKPDERRIEEIAFRTMGAVIHRPKLSTIQAGLLLLQRPDSNSWALISQLVGIGQDLGLHLDCTHWRISQWEKGLRKRLAWALYMQDKWGALVHGRPSHLTVADWDVRLVDASDFPESAADEDAEEGSTEVDKGRVLFCEMISLAQILADILRDFYSVAAEAEARANMDAGAGLAWVLRRAKPLQLQLKSWFTDLPDCLRLQDVGVRKLSSTGYLHLAYYAAEITLHRRIVAALGVSDGPNSPDSPELERVCRLAARERLVNALDFVKTLRPEHVQSFWYSASTYNFALIGTFISLLWVTSAGPDDAAFYKQKLDEYRWMLRLASSGSEVLERAVALLSASTGMLVKAVPSSQGADIFTGGSRHELPVQEHGPEDMYGAGENAAMVVSPRFETTGDEEAHRRALLGNRMTDRGQCTGAPLLT